MNDETISAFMDKELAPDGRTVVEQALASNPGAASRLRMFERADALLREALPEAPSARDATIAAAIMSDRMSYLGQTLRIARFVAPLAAACLLGLFLGRAALTPRASQLALHTVSPELVAALDTAASGASRQVGTGEATVAMTLRTDRGFCRQLRFSDASGSTDAIACREHEVWRIAFAAPSRAPIDAFRSAGSAPGAPMDLALDALGSPTLIDEPEERALIERHWDSP
jgi:hypothetical protein